MSKFVAITESFEHYYKLPDGIETLEDEKVETHRIKRGDLFLKLKDNDKWFRIAPKYSDDEGYFDEKKYEYYDEKDTPFYDSDDEESDEDEDSDDEDSDDDDDEDDDWKYLCPNLHWGGQYGCDLCCYDDHVKDIDNQEMEKEWLNSKNKYYYKLHKKWLQDKKQKEVSFNIAISKLKRNKIVNEGILLKLSMKNSGMF